jgi:hypothetical protein
MPSTPAASIVIPTRGRPAYLAGTLDSVIPQARELGAEVVVVNDGGGTPVDEVARDRGVRVVTPAAHGANAARNAGIAATAGDPAILLDDDIRAPDGWLHALLDGVGRYPDVDVFGGPITAVIDGGGPRSCGREKPPITTLWLGSEDRDAELVWSANMAIRRRALQRVGPFDESIHGRGEEEDWERRHRARGGRIRYLAGAGLEHRRYGPDASLRSLSAAGWALGRSARRFDVRSGRASSSLREAATVVSTAGHVARHRCPSAIVSLAHNAGRLVEALASLTPGRAAAAADGGGSGGGGGGGGGASPAAPGDDFLSGTSGQVWGTRATTRAVVADLVCDSLAVATLQRPRLMRAARRSPRRRVLVLAVERDDVPNVLPAARAELAASHHDVRFESITADGRGKFENLDLLLDRVATTGFDWLLVVDDDVALPRGFLDGFVFLAERFGLAIAQPAHRWRSHAAWNVTRRRPVSAVRETAFVEIGPLCALHARTFEALLPFPPLRFGWGLDAHWSAVAQARGWREGVVDATPIHHGLRRIASSYDPADAIAEGRRFLADRAFTPATQANRTLETHRGWR